MVFFHNLYYTSQHSAGQKVTNNKQKLTRNKQKLTSSEQQEKVQPCLATAAALNTIKNKIRHVNGPVKKADFDPKYQTLTLNIL